MRTREEALGIIFGTRLVAILRKVPDEKAVYAAEALLSGGIPVLEVTFDHGEDGFLEKTAEKIRMIREAMGDAVLLGAGTVLGPEEAEAAKIAGAEFIVTPNFDPAVIRRARELGMAAMPGAMTPTEIVNAYSAGADVVKLFPAGNLGPAYVKALQGPLGHIPLFAVGGVGLENMCDFLSAGIRGFGIGGELVPSAAVQSGDFAEIRRRAEAFSEAVRAWEES